MREDAPDIVAIDGKTSRLSHARRAGREPLHLVSAWAHRHGRGRDRRQGQLRAALLSAVGTARRQDLRARCAPTGTSRTACAGSLDVVFHDDLARLGTGHGPENMAGVKHVAMNILRQTKPTTSLKNRRKLAG